MSGGGAEITTSCDFVIMSKDAKIRFVQANMGVTTGFGGTYRLTKILGRQKAIELLCSTDVITSDKAMDIGYIKKVINLFQILFFKFNN